MSERYESPLCKRYASSTMQRIFSSDSKFSTWRRLWVSLAESQMEMGLPISPEQIEQMKEHIHDINYEVAARYEAEIRHDVMAHIRAFGDQCPLAKPVIHLGATSCYVGDNTDIILQRKALLQVKSLLLGTIEALHSFAEKYKSLPCLAFTHFQAAQPTTVGKRATLWIADLLMDLEQLDFQIGQLKLLGCKGTTGTSASFLSLFDGDHRRVCEMEQRIAHKMGFDSVYPISGQTYSRKIDYNTLSVLSGIAQSAYKFSSDIRLLSHLKEVEEPFEESQVGSSAMAYKRNPMRSERIASLARFVTVTALNPALTASAQWLERTLDDSANKRIAIPEAFLATDGMLSLMRNVASGLCVYPKIVQKHLAAELPFMATENILMHCVLQGGDRQVLHERIRLHAMEAAKRIKLEGEDNDLLERIANDPLFDITKEALAALLSASKFTGRATEQVEDFLPQVQAILAENKHMLAEGEPITV